MNNEFKHIPVLLNEVINGLDIKSDGTYADGTAGGGGHSHKIGEKLSDKGMLISVDRDIDAINTCRDRLKDLQCKVELLHSAFSQLPEYLNKNKIMLDGLLLDLGVSSYQLDTADRGFSYMQNSDLDMRMDRSSGLTAKYIVNNYSDIELERIFHDYGEERFSKKIALQIVKERSVNTINTTFELVDIIKRAMPKHALYEKQHPAKRVFQAIRIEVNDELHQVEKILTDIIPCMKDDGVIAVITFHSLEDRLIKTTFAKFQNPCTCPSDFPVCVCGKKSSGKALSAIVPTEQEINENPRSRSARLRLFKVIKQKG